MATWQRRHGQKAWMYPRHLVADSRGNEQYMPDFSAEPLVIRVAESWQRSSRAEVPGQQTIDMRDLITRTPIDPERYGVWSAIYFDDSYWDITAPPAYRHGTRHVRHWTIRARRRTSSWGAA